MGEDEKRKGVGHGVVRSWDFFFNGRLARSAGCGIVGVFRSFWLMQMCSIPNSIISRLYPIWGRLPKLTFLGVNLHNRHVYLIEVGVSSCCSCGVHLNNNQALHSVLFYSFFLSCCSVTMVALKKVVLFIGIASALIIERDVTTVLSNLKAIDTACKKLYNDCIAWAGDASGALTIQTDESAVDKAFKNACTEAKTETVESSADSKSILAYLTGTVEVDCKKALDCIVSKKPQFTAVGLSSTVLSDLKSLKTDFDCLGAALKALASSDQKTPAQNAINTIDSIFNSAIAVYS